jgi:hypothetical protein
VNNHESVETDSGSVSLGSNPSPAASLNSFICSINTSAQLLSNRTIQQGQVFLLAVRQPHLYPHGAGSGAVVSKEEQPRALLALEGVMNSASSSRFGGSRGVLELCVEVRQEGGEVVHLAGAVEQQIVAEAGGQEPWSDPGQ